MGYTVVRADEQQFAAPSWNPGEPLRRVVELRGRDALLRHSQANLWLFPPDAEGRRHREPLQEEVFCVVEGTLTVYLGEPPERVELPPRSVLILEPKTAIQLRNESDRDVVFFAYGAPEQASDYSAETLESAERPSTP